MQSRVVQNIARASRGALWRLSGSVLGNVPLRAWPRAIGRIHGLHVPQRVRPCATPTPASPANINILIELLDSVRNVAGDVAECGVFQGSTLIALALHLRQTGNSRTVYGFDSFEGFGETIVPDLKFERTLIDPKMRKAGFSNTSLELVAQKSSAFGLSNVRLIKGYFETSLVGCPETTFAFIHLDCDTYSAYRDCLHYFYDRLTPGAIVVFDEYDDPAWPGCNAAVDEFLSDKPERLVEICRDNYVKTYFVKQ